MDDIAVALGVGRRTLFRYFRSKNDMVWGDFDRVLRRLRAHLEAAPAQAPLMDALAEAVVASNRYDDAQLPELRIRMTLITTVPALQAHAMLRYAAWRQVIAEYVAERVGLAVHDLLPQAVAHAALGTSMAAFVRWVRHPGDDLEANLREGYTLLASGFAPTAGAPPETSAVAAARSPKTRALASPPA
jgi:mycofactocin system transcriptional regulator